MLTRLACARCNLGRGSVWTDEPAGLLRELCRREDCAAERQTEAAEQQRQAAGHVRFVSFKQSRA